MKIKESKATVKAFLAVFASPSLFATTTPCKILKDPNSGTYENISDDEVY